MRLLAAFLVMAVAFGVAWRLTAPRPTVVVAPAPREHDPRLEGYDWVDREHGVIPEFPSSVRWSSWSMEGADAVWAMCAERDRENTDRQFLNQLERQCSTFGR